MSQSSQRSLSLWYRNWGAAWPCAAAPCTTMSTSAGVWTAESCQLGAMKSWECWCGPVRSTSPPLLTSPWADTSVWPPPASGPALVCRPMLLQLVSTHTYICCIHSYTQCCEPFCAEFKGVCNVWLCASCTGSVCVCLPVLVSVGAQEGVCNVSVTHHNACACVYGWTTGPISEGPPPCSPLLPSFHIQRRHGMRHTVYTEK